MDQQRQNTVSSKHQRARLNSDNLAVLNFNSKFIMKNTESDNSTQDDGREYKYKSEK